MFIPVHDEINFKENEVFNDLKEYSKILRNIIGNDKLFYIQKNYIGNLLSFFQND